MLLITYRVIIFFPLCPGSAGESNSLPRAVRGVTLDPEPCAVADSLYDTDELSHCAHARDLRHPGRARELLYDSLCPREYPRRVINVGRPDVLYEHCICPHCVVISCHFFLFAPAQPGNQTLYSHRIARAYARVKGDA